MSGEAGWGHEGDWYWLNLGSGISVEVAEPDPSQLDWSPNYTTEYFNHENRTYEEWIERAVPKLDLFFQEVAKGDWFPIAPLEPEKALIIELDLWDSCHASGRIRLSVRKEASKSALDRFQHEATAIIVETH